VIRPPDAKLLVQWGLDRNSELPEVTEFKMRGRDIRNYERRVQNFQVCGEALRRG
jgi:hypothetical protein